MNATETFFHIKRI